MGIRGFTKALVVVGFSAFSSMASADFIQTFAGNDCSGVFGQGFANCKIPANIDPNESPIIIKYDFGPDGVTFEINPLFPTIDGSEFDFDFSRRRRDRDLDIHPRARAILASISLSRRVDPTSTSSATWAIHLPTLVHTG